jgi:hypothetical protein
MQKMQGNIVPWHRAINTCKETGDNTLTYHTEASGDPQVPASLTPPPRKDHGYSLCPFTDRPVSDHKQRHFRNFVSFYQKNATNINLSVKKFVRG